MFFPILEGGEFACLTSLRGKEGIVLHRDVNATGITEYRTLPILLNHTQKNIFS